VSGAPYMTASIEGAHSTYRTGGLANFINNKLLAKPLGEGLTLGTNMYVRQGMNDIGTMNHEGYHVNQQMDMGWASFYGNLAQDFPQMDLEKALWKMVLIDLKLIMEIYLCGDI
jgi:hypothetical protein